MLPTIFNMFSFVDCPDYELAQSGKKHSLLIASAQVNSAIIDVLNQFLNIFQGADCGRFTIQVNI